MNDQILEETRFQESNLITQSCFQGIVLILSPKNYLVNDCISILIPNEKYSN